jgi:hypothetical protein
MDAFPTSIRLGGKFHFYTGMLCMEFILLYRLNFIKTVLY